MEQRLSLATWSKPEDAILDEIETAVVRSLRPPLNLDKVRTAERATSGGQECMADIARAWQPDAGPGIGGGLISAT